MSGVVRQAKPKGLCGSNTLSANQLLNFLALNLEWNMMMDVFDPCIIILERKKVVIEEHGSLIVEHARFKLKLNLMKLHEHFLDYLDKNRIDDNRSMPCYAH